MITAPRWRARGATLEAIALLGIARMLVSRVPFSWWRPSLGTLIPPPAGNEDLKLEVNLSARRVARAVERAARRLPGETLCLPQAMALQWMLRRRRMDSTLFMGVRPGQHRGTLDDLHAWVARRGETLIGARQEPHVPLFAARQGPD